jgi:hypothetical protein
MSTVKRVFVSYGHADAAWCTLFKDMLESVHDPLEYDVWVDDHKIRAGDQWTASIDAGLREADAAVLLISKEFLKSRFIRDVELPRLLARRNAGMLVVPVLVGACPWREIAWIEQSQLRPRGGRPPGPGQGPETPEAAAMASEVVEEITRILKKTAPAGAARDVAAVSTAHDPAALLLSAVLLQAQSEEGRGRLAKQLVALIAAASGLAGPALFMAVRLFVEFQLLRADDPFSPQALLDGFSKLPNDRVARPLLDSLKRGASTGDYSQISIPVSSMFFMLSREREEHWQAYFEALRDPALGGLAEDEIGTLARVDVQWGFLAPQYLLAGLMSRFNEDWRPILGVYRQSLPVEGARDGGFASLQASQWNCWLVWGPSVPICRCLQWHGHYAFQYGYGDENNSLPLLDTKAAPGTSELDALARAILDQGTGAGVAKLSGRLRWGPYLLRPEQDTAAGSEVVDEQDDPDPDDYEPVAPPAPTRKLPLADAQSALLCGDALAQSEHSDGLLLELSGLQPSTMPRAYFSAYLWMMFLVCTGTDDKDGPRLLWNRHYPRWPDRAQVRSQELWRDLLPVFVHANIADAAALRLQRRTLIENALATLRNVWLARADNFDPGDVDAGIRFHLVCASDYSGCGDPVRFPPAESLCDLLRERLAAETDAPFAQAVVLPDPAETPDTRAEGLAGYYSSCHLNEMIADYFDHVARLKDEKPPRRR